MKKRGILTAEGYPREIVYEIQREEARKSGLTTTQIILRKD